MTNKRQAASTAPTPDPKIADQAAEDIRRRLRQAGKPDVTSQVKRTFGDEVSTYGVKAPDALRIGQDVIRRMRTSGLPVAMEVADRLFKSRNLEEGVLAAQLVASFARHISGNDFERFDPWADSLTNPTTADALATQLVSKALAAKPSLVARLKEWAKSPSPWRRRAAVMSFVPLVREGRFVTDSLSVAELLLGDADDYVQEGLGNLLMETARLNEGRVAEFLSERKGKISDRVLRIAAAKLSTSNKAALFER